MKPEAQRIAIAEARGWSVTSNPDGQGVKWIGPNGEGLHGGGKHGWGFNDEPIHSTLPDYLNDLNAIMPVVQELPLYQFVEVANYLRKLVKTSDGLTEAVRMALTIALATPEQWCEAFLRTIGKWEESV